MQLTEKPEKASRRGARYLFPVLALLMGGLAGAVLAEILLRALWADASRYYLWPPHFSASFQPNPAVVHGVGPEAHIEVNSVGVLGDEMPADKATHYRILAVGGSTTQCIMLDQSKTWPSLLAQALGATADGRRVWVGNLGRAGFNSRDHLGAMRFVVDQYEPDAIVMLAGGNDMVDRIIQGGAYDPHFVDDEQRYRDWLMSRFVMRPLSAWSGPFYRRTAIWQLAKWVNSLLFGRRQLLMDSEGKWLAEARSYRQQMRDRVDGLPSLDDGLEEYARNLRAISEEARKRPVRLVLLTQPTLWKSDMPPAEDKLLYYGFAPGPSGRQLEWPWWKNSDTILYSPGALRSAMDSYNRRLLKTCSEVQAECFDLASRLPQTTDVFFDDMHYTERGARQFADAVASYLKTTAPFAQ